GYRRRHPRAKQRGTRPKLPLAPFEGERPAMIRTSQPGTLRAAVNIANRALVEAGPDGSFKGPSAEIAIRLASRLAFHLHFVVYQSASQIHAATDRDEWDIAFLASDPQRKDRLAFSAPYLSIQA